MFSSNLINRLPSSDDNLTCYDIIYIVIKYINIYIISLEIDTFSRGSVYFKIRLRMVATWPKVPKIPR